MKKWYWFFHGTCQTAKNSCQKGPKSEFQSRFSTSKILQIFLKKNLLKNVNLGTHFLFLSILCSMKIERLLFLKFLKFWLFLTAFFGHLTSVMKNPMPFLWSVQSWLQSEMFLSNSVDMMKNLQLYKATWVMLDFCPRQARKETNVRLHKRS